MATEYRDWTIKHNPKYISTKEYDWDAVNNNYYGETELCFTAESLTECKKIIDDYYEELSKLYALSSDPR